MLVERVPAYLQQFSGQDDPSEITLSIIRAEEQLGREVDLKFKTIRKYVTEAQRMLAVAPVASEPIQPPGARSTAYVASATSPESFIKVVPHPTATGLVEVGSINAPEPYTKGDPNNVLIIGDTHAPFTLEGYLEHCRDTQEKYDCGTVVHIGDVIDKHYSSYHESDPDGMGAGQELEMAIKDIARWHHTFPGAYVTVGNHDLIVVRKTMSAGLSKRWTRDFADVLQTPSWKYVDAVEIHGVEYTHGKSTAKTAVRNEMCSRVQGHLHSQAYIEHYCGTNFRSFAMQVGAGIDRKQYPFEYGKHYKKPFISCGVVLNQGTLPIIEPMHL